MNHASRVAARHQLAAVNNWCCLLLTAFIMGAMIGAAQPLAQGGSMAKMYVSEYSAYGFDPNTAQAVGREPAIVDQAPVTIGAGSLQSAPFNTATRLVRVHVDAICSIVFGNPTINGGTGPVATANNKRLAANQTEYFAVNAGDVVAVITNT